MFILIIYNMITDTSIYNIATNYASDEEPVVCSLHKMIFCDHFPLYDEIPNRNIRECHSSSHQNCLA